MGHLACPETSLCTNLWCVTSQKSEDLVYTAAEAWRYTRVPDDDDMTWDTSVTVGCWRADIPLCYLIQTVNTVRCGLFSATCLDLYTSFCRLKYLLQDIKCYIIHFSKKITEIEFSVPWTSHYVSWLCCITNISAWWPPEGRNMSH